MSLEAILQENTKAVQENTAALLKLLDQTVTVSSADSVKSKAENTTVVSSAKTGNETGKPVKVEPPKKEKIEEVKEEAVAPQEEKRAITKDDCGALVMEIVKNKDLGRDSAVSLLAEFGVKKAGELAEDQYEAFVNRANEVLLGV